MDGRSCVTRLVATGAAVLAMIILGSEAGAGATVRAVERRGELVCGVANDLHGFSAPDSRGRWSGLDVDVCRAVAAAVFGDASRVRYVPLSAQARLTALQTGDIDLVPKSLGAKSALELSGATVCVQTGTTTELNLADYFRANNMDLSPVTLEKYEEMIGAYVVGRCDALSADASALATIRANATPRPDEHVILPELISKEPLAPAVRQGDDQWFDIVRWTQFAMIEAEERGITSRNVDTLSTSNDPSIKRLLGVTPGMGAALGLKENWAYAVIKQVGNYGESFDRNVGVGSKLDLPRGLNALWTQ